MNILHVPEDQDIPLSPQTNIGHKNAKYYALGPPLLYDTCATTHDYVAVNC